MEIDIINQSYFEDRNEFVRSDLTFRWDNIVMVTAGEYSVLLEGATSPISIKSGDVAYFPSGTVMHRSVLSPLTFYSFSFTSQPDHPFRLSMPIGKLKLPAEQTAAIFNSIKRAMLIPSNQELIVHTIEHIMATNYMFGKSGRVHLRTLSEDVLSTVSYMNRNLGKKIDMDELAARVYLSHTGLIWKFRQELNTTPSKYLIMLRMRYAKQLLIDHDYSITTVAEMCGYSNPFYFTNAFRSYSGMSPSEFRKHYLGIPKSEKTTG